MTTAHTASADTPGPSRNYARGAIARERILDVAIEEFGRRGYWGAAVQEIADRVGMSKAGLMHHFPTKEALLSAVMAEADERDRSGLGQDDLHAMRGLEVFDALDRLVERNAGRRALVQLGHVLRAQVAGEEVAVTQAGRRHFTIAREIVALALRAGVEAGEVRTDVDVDLTALLAVATMEGLESQWLCDPSRIDLVGAYQAFTSKLRRDLRA